MPEYTYYGHLEDNIIRMAMQFIGHIFQYTEFPIIIIAWLNEKLHVIEVRFLLIADADLHYRYMATASLRSLYEAGNANLKRYTDIFIERCFNDILSDLNAKGLADHESTKDIQIALRRRL